ncbi:MAG: DUF4280 domain-containing protein [Bacteroidetes bacterium]|nr:DUF4280 domain-containing protein [Bacteroidota bacterium]
MQIPSQSHELENDWSNTCFVLSRCIPLPVKPWAPVAKKLKIGGKPAMLQNSKTMCVWMGQITVQKLGLTNVQTK